MSFLYQIRFRLLLINALAVAVPIVGIGFARFYEREMLGAVEADMIHQGELVRELLATRPHASDPALASVRAALVRAMHAAGVPLLAGTDTDTFGFALHRELEAFVEAGLSPGEALQTATINPARFAGLENEVGREQRRKPKS